MLHDYNNKRNRNINEKIHSKENNKANLKQRISVAYENPGGIDNKAEMLSRNITAANHEIIIFTETWISDEDSNEILSVRVCSP